MSTRRVLCLAMTLLGFGLRVHDLGAVTLRWDEGWSIALARLPLGELLRLTALDVHPPLYYLLLAPWVALAGSHELVVRWLSVAAGTAAVPLAAWAARAWWTEGEGGMGRRAQAWSLPFIAALYAAVAPALVYYGGVARMYALTTPLLFGAAAGLGRMTRAGRLGGLPKRALATFVLAAAGALHAFYYTGFALAGLLAGRLAARPRQARRIVGAGVLLGMAALPWFAYALPLLAARTAGQTMARGGFHPAAVAGLLPDAWRATVFAERWTNVAMATPLVLVGLATLLSVVWPSGRPGRWRRLEGVAGLLGLMLAVVLSLLGAAAGAQGHMFAARYVIEATPFVVLAVAWAASTFGRRSPWLAAAATIAAVGVTVPTLTDYVYNKTAEVTEAFDPSADWRALHQRVDAGDVVVFNILSLAGLYDRYRTESDPPWSYAQLWDPVHEPPALAEERLVREVGSLSSDRFWLVLYKGVVSDDSRAFKDWVQTRYAPGEGWWQDDRLYQSYITAGVATTKTVEAEFGSTVSLESAEVSGTSEAGRGITVRLHWRALAPASGEANVFVHAYGEDGRLVAQHDSVPVFGERPTTSWAVGERLADPHGLWIPRGVVDRRLRLAVGLYDPATGRRWTLKDGLDNLALGEVALKPR